MKNIAPTLLAWPARLIARAPLSISTKLLLAFLVIVGLLILVGTVALEELAAVNRRAENQVKLQRKIAAYRQLQQDTTAQLYGVASTLLVPEDRVLDATLRQLDQFGYDLDRLQFVTANETELFGQVRRDYEAFIAVVTQVVELVRAGKVGEGRDLLGRTAPLAERLEQRTNELVNQAETDMAARVDEGHDGYVASRRLVIAFSLGAIVLAICLGYAISHSLILPVRRMDARFEEISSGDFDRTVDVVNRDELGALAEHLNRMSAELGRLYRQVEAANRNKSVFLANMSHELRTPLNAIMGFSEVLRDELFGAVNEKQREYLGDIHSSGQHLLALINDILDLSKIEAGRMELELSRFNLEALLDNALVLVRERAGRHGIALKLEIDPELGECTADVRKVKQVVVNLLSNAVKFTPEGGSVTLRARRVEGAVEVAVIDTGIGIPAADQGLVFEEFRQASGDHLKKSEGTGLGLSLAKRFVELHGGSIQVQSAPGHGSTFAFSLPEGTTHQGRKVDYRHEHQPSS